jgi:mannose/fructose/N-acetylgalactosamine-specific phosphotransferase system component IIC
MFIGLILGQIKLGLTLGLWAEVLWLSRPPLGGAIIPNGALAVSSAMVGIAGSLSLVGVTLDPSKPVAVLAMALVPPLAHYMTLVEPVTRAWSRKVHEKLKTDLEADRPLNLVTLNLTAVCLTFLMALVLSLIGGLIVAMVIVIAISSFPQSFWQALVHLEKLVPLLCLVYMGLGLHRQQLKFYSLATVILLAILSLLFVLL